MERELSAVTRGCRTRFARHVLQVFVADPNKH